MQVPQFERQASEDFFRRHLLGGSAVRGGDPRGWQRPEQPIAAPTVGSEAERQRAGGASTLASPASALVGRVASGVDRGVGRGDEVGGDRRRHR